MTNLIRPLQITASSKYCKVLEESPECFVCLAFRFVVFQSSAESVLSDISTHSIHKYQ